MRAIVARLLKLRAQVVEEERIEHLQDVRHAGVVHAERAALLVLGDGLDHRAEDVRVDLRPVEIADVEKVGARDPAEARHVHAAGEQPAVHVGKRVGPAGKLGGVAILDLGVHGAEQLADHLVGVGRIPRAHLLDGGGEQAVAVEDVGVLGEEAEDQPRHEMVHVVAALGRAPFGVVLQQLDIEPVQAAGRPDVEGAFADLLDGGDAGQRQEEAEMVREIRDRRRRPSRRSPGPRPRSRRRRSPG